MEIVPLTISKDQMNASFILKDTTPAFANTLRRLMIEEVPAMAIEFVDFSKNSSILYDEIIAHRMGLLPLVTDIKSYNLPAKCKCNGQGCARCTLELTLKGKSGVVYASEVQSKDPKVRPVFGKTPIVKLLKNQELELKAIAMLGKGKDHMKWSPCHVYYKYKPAIEIIDSKVKDADAIAKSCPKGVFEAKAGKLTVNKSKLFDCDLCVACSDAFPAAIKLEEKSDEIIFYVESFGQLKVADIVASAADMFNEMLDELSVALKATK